MRICSQLSLAMPEGIQQSPPMIRRPYSTLIVCTALLLSACSGSEADTPSQQTIMAAKKSAPKTLEERGARIYKRCRACHTLNKGGRHKVGPNLWAIYGATAGTKDGYAYSKAMKTSEIVWDQDTMDAYLKRPEDYVPGTKMSFIGLKKQEDRDAVQVYIKTATTP